MHSVTWKALHLGAVVHLLVAFSQTWCRRSYFVQFNYMPRIKTVKPINQVVVQVGTQQILGMVPNLISG
jgi:hypothetical protein